jgi:4-hydroxybenzoate polyprenyltransferase
MRRKTQKSMVLQPNLRIFYGLKSFTLSRLYKVKRITYIHQCTIGRAFMMHGLTSGSAANNDASVPRVHTGH